jgi:hypothetical protein
VNRPGSDLTYFRVEFAEQEPDAAAEFKRIYGDQPREIRIILPFNEIERMWDAWLEAYTAGRLVARSDGERFIYLVDTRTGEVKVRNGAPETPYKDGMVVGTWRNQKTNKDEPITCKPTGRLKVILPELARAAYMTVLTTSIHDIANISAQLEAFKTLNNGQIAGIPLMLRRRPKKISMPKPDGGRARVTKWMLSIEADPQWVKAMLSEVKRLALPVNGLALLTEGGAHEAEDAIDMPAGYVDEDGDEGEQDPGIADNQQVQSGYFEPKREPDPAAAQTPAAAAPKPNGKPIEQPGMTLEQAAAVKTPNGTPLGTCTDEQLKVVIGNTGPKTTSSIKAAATLLLAKPDAEAWSAWYALVTQSAELGLSDLPQPVDGISANGLRRMYAELLPKMEALVESRIPADFR